MRHILLMAVCLISAGCTTPDGIKEARMVPALKPWHGVEPYNDGWLYLEVDSKDIPSGGDWQAVSLPHCWNASDALVTNGYRRGYSWYRHGLKVTASDLEKRLFLRFGAAGMEAAVLVNGAQVTNHLGAYSAFTVEMTKLLKPGANQIDVRVCNRGNKDVPPVADGLFNFYGGLYRGVQLIRAPSACISRDYRGGPGVRVWSEKVSAQSSDLNVQVSLDGLADSGSRMTCVAELSDKSGNIVSRGEAPAVNGLLRIKMSDVAKPQLWTPENPVLYSLSVKLLKDGAVADCVSVRHGFRWFEFTAEKGFFLNGQSYKLRGVSRHQDLKGVGNAVSLAHHLNDIKLMKELGVNWLRLAHYQQDDYVLQLCDELGLLVWEEIPYVNDSPRTPLFESNSESMLVEMIEQHYNHPSIILWGMGNEIWLGKGADGKALEFDFISRLHNTIHREDPVRKSVIVCDNDNYYSNLKIMRIPDVIAYNLYCGWYGGTVDRLTKRLTDLHMRDPDKPLILSEFGAGADPEIHSENPKCFDQSQEYQLYFLESYLKQIDAMPWLAGYNWWNFADFGWANSKVPKFYNNKGFLTFDRNKKKDIFYLIKSVWTREPVVFLCSPTLTERNGFPDKKYRVISNMAEVELFLDGKSLGKQTSGFVWDVKLKPGRNKLLARGASGSAAKEHGFNVTYNPGNDSLPANQQVDFSKQAIDSNPVKKQK